MIYGVLRFDGNTDSAKNVFDEFQKDRAAVLETIKSAFRFIPNYTKRWDFDIEISETSGSSRDEKIEMTLELMAELGTDEQLMAQWEESMHGVSRKMSSLKRQKATKNVLLTMSLDAVCLFKKNHSLSSNMFRPKCLPKHDFIF